MRQLLVVGGAGFIGREFLRQVIHNDSCGFSSVRVIDKLTYASNIKELEEITGDGIEVDVTDIGIGTVVGTRTSADGRNTKVKLHGRTASYWAPNSALVLRPVIVEDPKDSPA